MMTASANSKSQAPCGSNRRSRPSATAAGMSAAKPATAMKTAPSRPGPRAIQRSDASHHTPAATNNRTKSACTSLACQATMMPRPTNATNAARRPRRSRARKADHSQAPARKAAKMSASVAMGGNQNSTPQTNANSTRAVGRRCRRPVGEEPLTRPHPRPCRAADRCARNGVRGSRNQRSPRRAPSRRTAARAHP